MLHHVGLEIEADQIERSVEFGRLLGEGTVAGLREHGFEVEPRREHWGMPRALARAPGDHRVELMERAPGA